MKPKGIHRTNYLPDCIQHGFMAFCLDLIEVGCVLGYLASLLLNQVLSKNISLYFGTTPRDFIMNAIPLLGRVASS